MAEELRLYMTQSMKMEPAPWIRDYVVNMEELYTELTLEKIDKKLFREERRKLQNYKELFAWHKPGMLEYLDIRYYHPKLSPKTKILFKGDPGMGKTSLVKKVAWDWAQRLFIKVSIVLFVFLKLVKPGDQMEDIILQQNELQGDKVTKRSLAYIFNNFGHECLLILDGLDECALGQNSDVLAVIRGSKFKNCNVLLTSRPHSTRGYEKYFDTIVSVEGFTRKEARKFARRIVGKKKVKQVLNFNPAGERANRPVHNVPILLSFLCLLVREDPDIDLSDTSISKGEIYFRMVQCLYKKFTIRKGIKFEKSSLITVLLSIGKLALETLLSGNPLLERSKIIEEVGEDVFEYGLLIGQDGFSLTRDMAADILVTFPHRSLQEFLGAFYFILSLGKKQTVHHVDKALEEWLKNPLFSEFCLWFLDESNRLLSSSESSVAHEMLTSYTSEQIDDVKVDSKELAENYPVLNLALVDHNKIALTFLEGVLGKCCKMKILVVELCNPYERILRSIDSVAFQRLNSVELGEFAEEDEAELIPEKSPLRFLCERSHWTIDLTVKWYLDEDSVDALNTVLKFCESRNRSVYLRVRVDDNRISPQDFPSVRTLIIDSSIYRPPMNQMYPRLANLFLTHCSLSELSKLAEANAEGKLPNLLTLEISDSIMIMNNLSTLVRSPFPSLHTLILSRCYLQVCDVDSLQQAQRDRRLPKLRHLDVSFSYSNTLFPLLFEQGIFTFNTLVLRRCGLNFNDLDQLYHQAVKKNAFISELITLDISHNPHRGSLSALMSHCFPHLEILVLRQGLLDSDDLISLAEASNQGRLPELRHLDVSENKVGWGSKGISALFGELRGFSSLINLILCACGLELQDLCCLIQAKLDGKLPRIRHLDISLNGLSDHVGILSRDPITKREISWENVICCEEKDTLAHSRKDFTHRDDKTDKYKAPVALNRSMRRLFHGKRAGEQSTKVPKKKKSE